MAVPPIVDPLTNLQNESSAVTKINQNAQRASDAIAKALSTTDTTQNTMNVPLDMNSQRILNLPAPTASGDPIRLQDRDILKGDTGPKGDKGEKGNDGTGSHDFNVLDFGAVDDGVTDNTAAIQRAINVASPLNATLKFTRTVGRTGQYKIGAVNWLNTVVDLDSGVQILNLDGSRYNGGFSGSGGGLIGLINPGFDKRGRRVIGPTGRTIDHQRPGDRDYNFMTFSGHSPNPYNIYCATRDFSLLGQSEPTSGSQANLGLFFNGYDVSNGLGVVLTAIATNGSPVLTNVTPSPTGMHDFTHKDGTVVQVQSVTYPAAITGNGIPAGSSVRAFDANTITLGAAGSYEALAPYTGPSGPVTIRVVSGRCEFNSISFQQQAIGVTGQGGPAGGLNWYNDIFVAANRSTDAANQEAALYGLQVVAVKQAPGLLRDDLHNGSGGLVVQMFPAYGNDTYTVHDGIVVTGWAGPNGTTGSQSAGTSPAAENGIRIGGGCSSVYTKSIWNSWFKVGLNLQSYETAIIISNPMPTGTGTAIYIAPGAGRIDADGVTVRGPMIEPNAGTPASATAPGVTGQHAWDANYEYRCVAPNRWRRIPFTSDWP